jgi:anti-sigma B factor antagonist
VAVVRPKGEFDLAEAEHLRSALLLACERTEALVLVDCAGVAFMDSTALGILVGAGKRLRGSGCRLQLVNVRAHGQRVIKIMSLWEQFDAHSPGEDLEPDVAMALAWTDDAGLRVTFG